MLGGKKTSFRKIFSIFLNTLIIVSTGLFIFSLLKLKGIENVLRIIFCISYPILMLSLIIKNFNFARKRKKIRLFLSTILSLLIISCNIFVYYNINKLITTLNTVSQKKEVVSISLIALKDSNLKIDDIKFTDKIGSISDEVSKTSVEMIEEFNKKNNIKNELIMYDNYYDLINDVLNKKIKYAFIPSDYKSIFSSQENYSEIVDNIIVIKSFKKSKKQELKAQKNINEPFTVLLMGVDTLTSSYNADTLLVVTFNPDTLSATMLSIPRDTYTTIACTGKKHKINSSGWSGDRCVVKTIENYIDVKIDYYAKINFTGVVELVDSLGGIEVDVPYSFCEQNSKREWGNNTVYVNKGIQTLNGEQALALSRNRHYWKGSCDKKYTREGDRNDFTRGQNQQLVLRSILNKVKTIDKIDTIYKIMDSLGNNMATDMSTDTMLSLYNVGKDILIKTNTEDKDISKVINIQKLKFTSYTKTIPVGGMDLSMVINYPDSVKLVSDTMKINLGLKDAKVIKTFEFDVNNSFEEKIIGSKTYGEKEEIETNEKVKLPNFIGRTYSYAENWAKNNGIIVSAKYQESNDSKYSEGEIIDQSIQPDTDISKIKNLVLTVITTKKTTSQFSYNQCLNEKEKTNEKCILKNFVGSDISAYKNWLSQTRLNIKTKYNTVSSDTNKITEQNISGISIYDIINKGLTVEVTYGVKVETTTSEIKTTTSTSNEDETNNQNE